MRLKNRGHAVALCVQGFTRVQTLCCGFVNCAFSAFGQMGRHFVLNDVPVLDEQAIIESKDIDDDLRNWRISRVPAMNNYALARWLNCLEQLVWHCLWPRQR